MLGIPIYLNEMRVIGERSKGISANGERVIYFSRETTFRRVYSLIKLNETAPHLPLLKREKGTRPRFRRGKKEKNPDYLPFGRVCLVILVAEVEKVHDDGRVEDVIGSQRGVRVDQVIS